MELNKNKRIPDTDIVFKEYVLSGLPSLAKVDLPHTPSLDEDSDNEDPFIYNILIDNLRSTKENGDCILINSFEDLEPEAFGALRNLLSIPVYGVGPLQGISSSSLWKEDEECLQWLDRQPSRSVVYISSGSLKLHSDEQVKEIGGAVLADNRHFLWSYRSESAADHDSASARPSLPMDFLTRTGDRGRVVEWAPQSRVLSHPSVGAFLTHCGWSSTMEAVTNGIPLICLPIFYDQFMDAKLAVDVWKMALRLATNSRGVAEKEELRRAFSRLIDSDEGEKLRANARTFQQRSQRAPLPGGTTYNDIQSFMKGLSQFVSQQV
ncbi:hypothetical protein KP509_23G010600 [Ceratopteris richardii]|nr:hypothetical protein KP509_23G010600 [Ceratopteris richardii]